MKIWFIARNFPPINTIGAERPKKFIRSLIARGHSFLVFTVSVPGHTGPSSFEGVSVARSAEILSPFRNKPGLPTFVRRLVDKVLGDQGWSWVPGLYRCLSARIERDGAPDVLIATGSPFFSFFVALKISKKYGVPLVLDYRDAWSNNPHHKSPVVFLRLFYNWCEKRLNEHAALLLTVSVNTGESLLSRKKPLVIYNLPDQGYMQEIERCSAVVECEIEEGKFALGYGGTLYRGRDLDPICRGINKLPDDIRATIVFVYCGASSRRAKKSFERHGLGHVLIDLGDRPKAEAVEVARKCDLMVSVISSSSSADVAQRGVITTKIFDYLILGKPFINIVPRGFEVSSLLDSLEVESCASVEPADEKGIADFIMNCSKRKKCSINSYANFSHNHGRLLQRWESQMDSLDVELARAVSGSLLASPGGGAWI